MYIRLVLFWIILNQFWFNVSGKSDAILSDVSEKYPDNTLLKKGLISAFIGCVILIILSTIYDKKVKKDKVNPFYTAFSIQKNFTTLFETNNQNDGELITCFNGIRVILQFFTVIIHFFIAHVFSPEEMFQNSKDVQIWKNGPWFYLTLSGHLLTEVSFIISAICLTDSFFRQYEKGFVSTLQK